MLRGHDGIYTDGAGKERLHRLHKRSDSEEEYHPRRAIALGLFATVALWTTILVLAWYLLR